MVISLLIIIIKIVVIDNYNNMMMVGFVFKNIKLMKRIDEECFDRVPPTGTLHVLLISGTAGYTLVEHGRIIL